MIRIQSYYEDNQIQQLFRLLGGLTESVTIWTMFEEKIKDLSKNLGKKTLPAAWKEYNIARGKQMTILFTFFFHMRIRIIQSFLAPPETPIFSYWYLKNPKNISALWLTFIEKLVHKLQKRW